MEGFDGRRLRRAQSLDTVMPIVVGRRRTFTKMCIPGTASPESTNTTSSLENSMTSPSDDGEGSSGPTPRNLDANTQEKVLSLLCSSSKLCAAVLEDDMGDAAMSALVKLLGHAGVVLPLIRDQVRAEFTHHANQQDAILRGNCVATRIMSAYASMVASRWLCKCIKSTVELLGQEKSVWHVDPARVPTGTPEEKEATARAAQVRLTEVATRALRKIEKNVHRAPRELRAMVYFIWMNARTFAPERTTVLLGGFVFLRLLNPALVDPSKTRGLVDEDSPERGTVFKFNAISLCKVLQNLSNSKNYPDAAMGPVNEWLVRNRDPLETCLFELATDPQRKEGERPFEDILKPDGGPPSGRHRDILSDQEWDALHIALAKSETHVKVRMTLAPVLGSEDVLRQSSGSGGGGGGGGGATAASNGSGNGSSGGGGSETSGSDGPSSLGTSPASPQKGKHVRQNSRYRGEGGETEVLLSQGGGIRLRSAAKRTSVLSQPNDVASSAPSSTMPETASSLTQPGEMGKALVRTARSSSSELREMPRISRQGSVPLFGNHRPSSGTFNRVEIEFYQLLNQLRLPAAYRLETFREQVRTIQRDKLVELGVLSEARRLSYKTTPQQVDALVQTAVALMNTEFGLIVHTFTVPVASEWMQEWLRIKEEKEVDHLLLHMCRSGLLEEKVTTREHRAYHLDHGRITEMSRLLSRPG